MSLTVSAGVQQADEGRVADGDGRRRRREGVTTFRFKHDQEVMDAVMRFAKIHQYDDRHDYKEAWNEWCDENREMLEKEARRLEDLGYEGDVYDKLFKSGRYYFRTKKLEKTAPVERKKYVGLNRDTLRAMDDFVLNILTWNHEGNDNEGAPRAKCVSPAEAFNMFCLSNQDTLRQEVASLLNDHGVDDAEVIEKIKKTFKNRYFQKARKI